MIIYERSTGRANAAKVATELGTMFILIPRDPQTGFDWGKEKKGSEDEKSVSFLAAERYLAVWRGNPKRPSRRVGHFLLPRLHSSVVTFCRRSEELE